MRLAFVFLCALPAVRELYQYINDPKYVAQSMKHCCHVTHSTGQKSEAHGTTLLAVARYGLDRTVGDYQMEPRNVRGASTRVCAMGLDGWRGTFDTVSDCPGKLSFLVIGWRC